MQELRGGGAKLDKVGGWALGLQWAFHRHFTVLEICTQNSKYNNKSACYSTQSGLKMMEMELPVK